MRLLIATNNPGKVAELERLLARPGLELLTPARAGLPAGFDVEETGRTFEANAILKATGFAAAAGLQALADDSGLEVDALDGQPGIYSKRYAGPAATDAERNAFLLSKLEGAPDEQRLARFVAVVAVADPQGRVLATARGVVEGRIIHEPRGTGGFGYDPLFVPLEGNGRTLAEMGDAEKDELSHRGRALRRLIPLLNSILKPG